MQDVEMPVWVGDGAAAEPLPVEPDAGDDAVLVGAVELRKGGIKLLVDPDVTFPLLVPPGCCALVLPAVRNVAGGM